jgi:hypothetical protein
VRAGVGEGTKVGGRVRTEESFESLGWDERLAVEEGRSLTSQVQSGIKVHRLCLFGRFDILNLTIAAVTSIQSDYAGG